MWSLNQDDQEWEDERGPGPWERWERNWMGLRDSPYRSLQWQVRLKLEVYGDRRVLDNPYHWDRVEFNLPGSKGYRQRWEKVRLLSLSSIFYFGP